MPDCLVVQLDAASTTIVVAALLGVGALRRWRAERAGRRREKG